MADAASRLTHLPDQQFFSHLCTHFPQSKPWSLLSLPSGYKQQLTNMLHNKQSPRGSLQTFSIQTPPPGTNGSASAADCKSPPTSITLRTPFPSSKFSPSMSVPAFCFCKVNLSRINCLSNTPARLVKSSHLWGSEPLPQQHGEARLSNGTPTGVLSEEGFSSNKSVDPHCQFYPSLGHCCQGKHRKNHHHQRSQLSRLLLPPPARRILQGRY